MPAKARMPFLWGIGKIFAEPDLEELWSPKKKPSSFRSFRWTRS